MITAVDTNIFVALWSGTAEASAAARKALEHASDAGSLVIAPPVYAELIAAPDRTRSAIDTFLHRTQIEVDWTLPQTVWVTAALAYRSYAQRQRAQRGDPGPRRILADFIIGAHAVEFASALLTFDHGVYRASFPALKLLIPAQA
jgi:predicted nucleic acid-binding protein